MADVDRVSVNLRWDNSGKRAPQAANQFNIQIVPDNQGQVGEVLLTVGMLTPPLTLGTPEEQRAQMEAFDVVPIEVLGTYAVSSARLADLRNVIDATLQQLSAVAVTSATKSEATSD